MMIYSFQILNHLSVQCIKILNSHRKRRKIEQRIQLSYWILNVCKCFPVKCSVFLSIKSPSAKMIHLLPHFKLHSSLFFSPCLIAFATISSTMMNKSKTLDLGILFLIHLHFVFAFLP